MNSLEPSIKRVQILIIYLWYLAFENVIFCEVSFEFAQGYIH